MVPVGGPPTEPPPAQKSALEVMMEYMEARFNALDKRVDQQGAAVVRISEIITSPPAQQAAQGQGLLGLIQQLVPAFNSALASGGENEMYIRVGKSVIDGALEGTIKRVVKAAGAEGAKHVTGLG